MKNEDVMSQLDAELAHAGEETALSPQMLLLEQLRITPDKQLLNEALEKKVVEKTELNGRTIYRPAPF